MANTKDKIIEIFEQNRGKVISGEIIANEIGISRNAVWKYIQILTSEGYDISKEKGKGYIFKKENDVLSKEGIKKYLNFETGNIYVYDKVSSTNDLLKTKSEENEWTVICACEQEKGKGRLGRSFYSPKDTGVYFSVLIKPTFSIEYSTFLTTACAVSVCNAINKIFNGLNPKIKWVNDIMIDEKKVCGILTEAQYSVENSMFDYVIVGIGINIYTPNGGFPDDIKSIASQLTQEKEEDIKNKIVAYVLNEYHSLYSQIGKGDYIASLYKDMSMVIGKNVTVIRGESKRNAKVLDIDNKCRLIVKYDDGEDGCLSSGEISIKVKKDE